MAGWQTTAAFREVLDGLRELEESILTGPNAPTDEQGVVEGYKFLATMFSLTMDLYTYADPARPRFVDINTPSRRDRVWGGDNTDAYYAYAPLDPSRRYRVRGNRGDSAYFSLTVYNEPEPGAWSNRVVGIVNDDDLDIDDHGNFELLLGPKRAAGYDGPFILLEPGAVSAVTRDYQLDPETGQRVQWEIECLDDPGIYRESDASTALALRRALRFMRDQFEIVPFPVTAPAERSEFGSLGHNSPDGVNDCAAPYQVPDANYGWSARDACYSFGSYSLRDDQALVITHRPPQCRFWNANVWNPYMGGYNSDAERVSVNNGSAVANRDGTVTIVIAQRQLAYPNSISTVGHEAGMIAFRWFHADAVPEKPLCSVVGVDDAPATTS